MSDAQSKPGEFAKAITTSDTDDIDFGGNTTTSTRGLWVGSGGDVSVEMVGKDGRGGGLEDPTVVFPAVPTGTLLPIRVTRVNATGTAASSLVAIW